MTLSSSLLGALESGTGALNLAGDLALSPLASADSPSFFLRESARSLAETRQTVTDTIEIVVENPKAVGLAMIDAATRTMKGIAEGDPRATARMFQGVFDVALGGKIWGSASKMVKQTAGAGRRVGRSVRDGGRPVVGKGVRYGPTNLGPLDDSVAATFRGGSYTATTVAETTTLYRVYGGSAGKFGPYWTRTKPSGPLQSQLDSALAPQWENTAQNVVSIRAPKGTTIYEGATAPQSTGVGQILGGGNQIYIPYVDPKWIQ